MSDYDQIEKIFNGSWKHDRDENMEAFMAVQEAPEVTKGMLSLKPTMTMRRDGDSLKQKTVMGPGMELEATLKLNDVLEWKDKEEDPMFHTKTVTTFKDGVIIQDIAPQKADGGKRHFSKMYVQGDELITELSLPEGSSVIAKRIYKRC